MGSKTILIAGELTTDALGSFHDSLIEADARKGTITVNICSEGGHLSAGTAFYELLRTTKNPVVTVGTGEISSMAVLLLMAGDLRIVTPGSTLLLHEGSVTIDDCMMRARAMIAEHERHHEWYCRQIADRSKQSLNTILHLAGKETYLPAQEALELRLVDEIRPYRSLTKIRG